MQPDRLIFHLQQKLTQLIVKAGFDHHARFALGCSGGVDSTVLAFAAHAWAVETGRHLYALVVDHRIQPDSASRAQASLKRLHAMGLEAYGLCPPERPASSSQRSARMIRFGLLQGWCVEKRITGLVLAHHGDDQVETFALRLEARSRACGLAAMAAVQPLHAVTLLRPMLDCKRCDIIKSAHALGLRWDEDPSNRNVNVRRVYFRTALREQPGLGECFDNTVKPLRRWRDALEDRLGLWWHKNAAGAWNRWGGASLRLDAFAELAPDVACHCFGQLLMRVSGRMIPPRRAQSLRVLHAMTVDDFRRCSLAGCLLAKRGDRLQIDHEAMQPASCAIRIANHRLLWCNRFHVLAQNAPGQARIGACGEAHGGVIRQMFKKHEAPHGETAILPSRAACAALPGLWLGGTLIALPFCDPAHRARPAGHPSRLPALHIASCARIASSKPYQ